MNKSAPVAGKKFSNSALFFSAIGIALVVNGISAFRDQWIEGHFQESPCVVTQQLPEPQKTTAANSADSIDKTNYCPKTGDFQQLACVNTQQLPQPQKRATNSAVSIDKTTYCPKIRVRYVGNLPLESIGSLGCTQGYQAQLFLLQSYPIGAPLSCQYHSNKITTFNKTTTFYQSKHSPSNYTSAFIQMGAGALLLFIIFTRYARAKHSVFNKKTDESDISNTPDDAASTSTKKPIGFLSLFTLMGFIFFFVSIHLIRQEWRTEHQYQQAFCKVLQKKLESMSSQSPNGKKTETYQSTFQLQYTVNEHRYEGWYRTVSHDRQSELNKLNQYTIGQSYPCWFDPDKPSAATLERGKNGNPLFFLLISLLFIGVGLYSLFNNKSK